MAATSSVIEKIGKAVKKVAKSRSSEWWYTPHMAAASRAIADRIPVVDLLLEVRDARIPLSSEYEQLRNLPISSKHIIVLNKMDLANRSRTKEWMMFFEEQKCKAFGVNSHNQDSIKQFLTFLQARVRELKKTENPAHTLTLMLVGIPNVGKSALANSLHQVGRISAAGPYSPHFFKLKLSLKYYNPTFIFWMLCIYLALYPREEKGKLKHSVVSLQPGETKGISSLKIASHPNIYVLDTPGVLPSELADDMICSKLALTGAIKDSLVGETELAKYLLSILCSSDEYRKWEKLVNIKTEGVSTSFNNDGRKKRQYPTDHTQDFIVNNVRRTLFETFSSFSGSIEDGENLDGLVEKEFEALLKVFHLPLDSVEGNYCRVATKLLNLYRTGRIGHYTLDSIPGNAQGMTI